MSTKMICDKCKREIDIDFWRGYDYVIQTKDGHTHRFNICSVCQAEYDDLMAQSLQKFLSLELAVIDWQVTPCR